MTRHLPLFLALTAVSAAVLVGVACTDSSGYGLTGTGGSGAGGAGGTGGAGATGGTGGMGIGGLGVGGICENSCSNDLQKVVNCDGTVVETCAPEKACLNGACAMEDPCAVADESKSSFGCDYYALKTGLLAEASGACFAAFIANTWPSPVKISVEYDGAVLPDGYAYIPQGQGTNLTYKPYDPAVGLGQGEVAILFLARYEFGFVIDCPMPAAISEEVGVMNTGRGKAFHITTDKPVVAYQILPYGGGPSSFTSASLLIPTSAWDVNHIAVNAFKNSVINAEASPMLDIVAREDNTSVAILPKAAIVGGPGVDPAVANVKTTYTLNKGEFLQIEQAEELTGSPILSDKPVGVFGGSSCLYIPEDKQACDSAHQQIPPVKALGSEYVGVRYRGRAGGAEMSTPWRIVGAVDGTMLTWEGTKPANAPDTLDLGTVLTFDAGEPFVVRSQDAAHPFYLSEYMTGGGLFMNEGDPEWVNVVPPAQYLDRYVMFADPTYAETNLVVVRTKSKVDGMFAPVTLDCAGELTDWTTVGDYEYTRVDLVTGNFMDVGGCSNGQHELTSPLPFGVTVWGWGSEAAQGTKLVSYAYPAGASIQPINDVTVLPDPE